MIKAIDIPFSKERMMIMLRKNEENEVKQLLTRQVGKGFFVTLKYKVNE